MSLLIQLSGYILMITVLLRLEETKGRTLKPSHEEMTVMEDVIGIYELDSIKSLITNSTSEVKNSLGKLKGEFTKSNKNEEIKKYIDDDMLILQNSLNNLKQTEDGSRKFLEDMYGGVLQGLQIFKNQFIQKLSNLKLFVEHQSQQFQSVLGKTSFASQQILANDCMDLYNLRYNASGSYWLSKFGLRVLCDMETDGGGWLIIQRRAKVSEQVDFNQDWFTYKLGFGNLDTEFWIGNDVLHVLTNQKPYELRIEMEDFENGTFYALYNNFRVGNEESFYALDIGNYSGNAADAFSYHHGLPFTTYDKDKDNYADGNCATYFTGGWWYDRCYDAHLNGIYPNPPDRKNASYISWWSRDESMKKVPLVLTNVVIKIRPNRV